MVVKRAHISVLSRVKGHVCYFCGQVCGDVYYKRDVGRGLCSDLEFFSYVFMFMCLSITNYQPRLLSGIWMDVP